MLEAPPGSSSLLLFDTARIKPGDRINVMMESGDTFQTTVVLVVDSRMITLANPLPRSVQSRAKLINLSSTPKAKLP
jgi:hypothetical protein